MCVWAPGGGPTLRSDSSAPAPECELEMQGSTSAYPPEGQGRTERRGFLPRRSGTTGSGSGGDTPDAPRVGMRASLEELIDDRLEEGLHAIEDQAAALMREIAGEM